MRRHLAKAFPDGDVNIRTAGTGVEGLQLINSRSFGCVFLDYLLPDMNGLDLLRSIYDAKTDLASVPVVMLTGKGSESVMLEALRWGAQDYIVKDNISFHSLKIALTKAKEVFELKRNRAMAEEKLQQAQKMEAVGQLTSGVAHDFNNLLSVVLGNVYLMQEQITAPPGKMDTNALAEELTAIETVARNGAELVRRLMLFSRQRQLASQTANVNDCIRDAATLLKASLGATIEVAMILAEGLPSISLDVSEFANVLINMSVNARDAMPGGGKLTFETGSIVLDEFYAAQHPEVKAGEYVMVAVSDTGTGIDREVAHRIFEPFFTTKPPGKGTGLGLAMVYGFVRQSGGHVDVYSEPGHGTVFRLYLPKAGEPDRTEAAPVLPEPVQPGSIILVAENDDEVRGTAVTMLEKLGYRTLQAKDGKVALDLVKREQAAIDLIFTDICMGGFDGVELVREARALLPALPAVFTSGYTEHTVRANKIAPDDDFIGKPYHQEALARKIHVALGKRKRENV